MMKAYLQHMLNVLRTSFWFVPAVFACAALLLALLLVWLDTTIATRGSALPGWLDAGDADGARQLLVTIAGSMLTVAGLVFSITMVALSMASAQFGPKLLRNYMRDRFNQIVLGVFIADFVYCLTVLRYVQGEGAEAFVPYIAVNVSNLLALVSLGVLIFFFHHMSSTIQADNVVAVIGRELDEAIDHWDSHDAAGSSVHGEARDWEALTATRDARTIDAQTSGYIQSIDYGRLVALAKQHDICFNLSFRPGHFVIEKSPLLAYARMSEKVDEETMQAAALETFIFGKQRSAMQDIEYPIDQLNQVAARALSPSLNDPYTAVVCADWLSAAISRLAALPFPAPRHHDDDGRLRLIANTLTFEGVVNTAFDEFRQGARSSVAVTIRLLESIAAIMVHAHDPDRLRVLKRQADMLQRASGEAIDETLDRDAIAARHRTVLALLTQQRGGIIPTSKRITKHGN